MFHKTTFGTAATAALLCMDLNVHLIKHHPRQRKENSNAMCITIYLFDYIQVSAMERVECDAILHSLVWRGRK